MRKTWKIIAAVIVAVCPSLVPAQDPDFTDVDDVLDGRRVLVDVVDLLAVEPLPIGDGSTTNPSRIVLETDDGKIVSESSTSDGVRNCEPSDVCINPFPQQERIVRLFNLPYDVRVAVAANANAAGTDCQGPNNLTVSVHDLVTGASTSREVSHSGAWLQLGVGDFNFDGFEELVLIDSTDMVVFGAQDVDDPAAGVVFHTTVSLPGSGYRALSQPTVGDINADGIREMIWAGGNKNGSQFVYVASICPGPVANTVCDSAQPSDHHQPAFVRADRAGGDDVRRSGGYRGRLPVRRRRRGARGLRQLGLHGAGATARFRRRDARHAAQSDRCGRGYRHHAGGNGAL